MRTLSYTYQGKTLAFDTDLGWMYGDKSHPESFGFGHSAISACRRAISWDFGCGMNKFISLREE